MLHAGNETVIKEKPSIYATMQCAGVRWNIEGDSNNNAVCSVEFREKGAPEWKKAMDLFRAGAVTPDKGSLETARGWKNHMSVYVEEHWKLNYLAGSIFNLKEGTEYEVKVSLKDPDGGEAQEILSVKTRVYPVLPDLRTSIFTEVKPVARGALRKAVLAAKDKDVLLVHAGTYDGNFKVTAPITIMAAGDGEVIIEGAPKSGSEEGRIGIDFCAPGAMLYGVTIKSLPFGINLNPGADRTSIMRCRILDCHYSIEVRSGENYIADNFISGDNIPAEGSIDGEGIESHDGIGQVICYNRITRAGDALSIETPDSDVFGNDGFNTSDDAFETDDGGPNIRIFNNRFYSCLHNGMSFQPYIGGPAYFIRNQIAGFQQNFFKDRYLSSGAVFINNTFLNNKKGALINHVYSRNNIYSCWAGPLDYHDLGPINQGYDLDYDCFISKMRVSASDYFEDIDQEKHGIVAKKEELFAADWNIVAPPAIISPAPMFELKDGCPAIDAGVEIPNITGGFTGKAPDMGALEKGAPLPWYGPRE